MRAPKYLIGGDWNEPPFSQGAYSAADIAHKTGGRVFHGNPGAMGRIDFLITDAHVFDMTLHDTGGSDHNLRSFTVRPGVAPSLIFLRGALWNAERDRHPRDVAVFLTAFLTISQADFVLLQEIQQYHHALGAIPGYRLLAIDGPGKNQNAILVSDTVKVTGFRVKRMAPWTWRTSAGVEHVSPYMPHACLNGWLRVASVHEMSQIDWRGGKMRGPRDRRRIRRTSAKRMVRFVELVRAGTWDQ